MSTTERNNFENGRFEKVLQDVGNAGRYQQLLVWTLNAPLNLIVSWIALSPILLTSTPDHWCDVPGRPDNVSQVAWVNWTVPRDASGSLSKCLQYNMSRASVPGLVDETVTDRQTIPCQHEFSYSTVDYDETLTTRHDWVCDNSGMVANWQTVGLAGNVVGTLFFDPLSDVLGRRLMIVVSAVIFGVMGVVRVYVQPLWLIMLTQLLASVAYPPAMEISLILVYEFVSDALRTRVTFISCFSWSLGTCVLAFAAFLTRSDRILSWVISIPYLLYLAAMWIIPESPRWLLTRGRVKEATAQLETVARVNGRDRPPDLDHRLKEIALEKQPHYGAIQLLHTKILRKRCLLLTMCYVLNTVVYYGISYNTSNLISNDFVNFFFMGLAEIPGNLLGWWSSQNIGRRWSQSLGFFMASVTVAVVLLVGEDTPAWVNMFLLIMSRFFVNIGFFVIFMQMAELYPTTHCGTGVGFASVVASTLGTTAPYIAYSSTVWWGLPYLILFTLGCCGCVVSSFIVETLGSSIPQTLQEAETLLLGVPYWSYRGRKFWKCNSKLPCTGFDSNNTSNDQVMLEEDGGADMKTRNISQGVVFAGNFQRNSDCHENCNKAFF